MFELLKDMYRHLLAHRATIEEFPLQIYSSSLVFSPTESISRRLFEPTQCPKWIMTKPKMQSNWSACIQTLEGHQSSVETVEFSPDNTKLASTSGSAAKIWDLATGICLQTFEVDHQWNINEMTFSPNGTQLALIMSRVSGLRRKIEIRDPVTAACIKTIESQLDFRPVAFWPDDVHLAFLDNDSIMVHHLNANEGLQTHNSSLGERVELSAPISCSPQFCAPLATISELETVILLSRFNLTRFNLSHHESDMSPSALENVPEPREYYTNFKPPTIYASPLGRGAKLSPDGQRFAIHGRNIQVWDFATKQMQRFGEFEYSVTLMEFSPDGNWLAVVASGIEDQSIWIWDIETGECIRKLGGHFAVRALTFSPDCLQLASGTWGGTIEVWDLTANTSMQEPRSRWESLFSGIIYSPNGAWLALSLSYIVQICDPATGECLQTFERLGRGNLLAISPDSLRIAVENGHGTIRIWDLASDTCSHEFRGHGNSIMSIAFSSSSIQLATADRGGTIKIGDLTTGKCSQTIGIPHFGLYEFLIIAFSPDDTQLWSTSNNGTIKIWDLSTGTCLRTSKNCLNPTLGLNMPHYHNEIQQELFAYISGEQHVPGLRISKDKKWILRRREPVLRLPPEYRPMAFAAHENRCAIGCQSGQVLCFQFSLDDLDAEINGE